PGEELQHGLGVEALDGTIIAAARGCDVYIEGGRSRLQRNADRFSDAAESNVKSAIDDAIAGQRVGGFKVHGGNRIGGVGSRRLGWRSEIRSAKCWPSRPWLVPWRSAERSRS